MCTIRNLPFPLVVVAFDLVIIVAVVAVDVVVVVVVVGGGVGGGVGGVGVVPRICRTHLLAVVRVSGSRSFRSGE